jgi:hypothetical protein
VKKQIVLISALVLILTACGGSSDDSSETEAIEAGEVTTQESGSEAGPGRAEAKQACEYWAIAQEQTIDTIGDYLLAAAESANEAAAISPEWDQLVTDLDTIYPLATDPDSGSPTDLLATSSSLDATCESYESWEGTVSAALPQAEGSSSEEQATAVEESLTPLTPEQLLAAVVTVKDLSEVEGNKWKSDKDSNIPPDLFVGPVRSGSELRNSEVVISPSNCDEASLFASFAYKGLPWATTPWAEQLNQEAEAISSYLHKIDFDRPARNASLSQWSSQVRLAPVEAISDVVNRAANAMESECKDAVIDIADLNSATAEDLGFDVNDLNLDPTATLVQGAFSDESPIQIVCYDVEYFTSVEIFEQVGAVWSKQGFQLDGSLSENKPDYTSVKPQDTLPKAIALYNRMMDDLANAQGTQRNPLQATSVQSACKEFLDAEEQEEKDKENAKYAAADVIYEVKTYEGGDITMETPTGTSQLTVGEEASYSYNDFEPGDFLYISVQNDADRGAVECAIYVDGEKVSSNYSDAAFGIATCEGNR